MLHALLLLLLLLEHAARLVRVRHRLSPLHRVDGAPAGPLLGRRRADAPAPERRQGRAELPKRGNRHCCSRAFVCQAKMLT